MSRRVPPGKADMTWEDDLLRPWDEGPGTPPRLAGSVTVRPVETVPCQSCSLPIALGRVVRVVCTCETAKEARP